MPTSLGIDAIWISPFYRSPMKDFGYDVSDYRDIDPTFGTLGDFDRLLEEAHRRGIRVLVDLVPNHTSDQHPWFVESRSSRDNPKRNWYVWADPRRGGPPNNWRAVFGAREKRSAWTLDPATGQYYLHHFLPQQPDLNWWNEEVPRAIVEEWERLLPHHAWPDYTLSNHDRSRAASRYGPRRARVAALMLLTLRGTPFIYYGEEIGMTDVTIPPERVVDVDGRDGERTPMQWDATPNAGFSTGRPWLPMAPDAQRVNVAAQRHDPS